MELGLTGRTAVVTGASRGIGLAVVRALAAEGVTVHAGARHTSPELTELVAGGSVHAIEIDLATPDGPAALVDAAGDQVHVLVNNVGAAPLRMNGFTEIADEQWRAGFEINFFAAVRATRAVLPKMIAAGGGSIIMISSVNSTYADDLVIDYCAAKAALGSFSKSLAREYASAGIRVNTISPGQVSTDLWLGAGGVAETVAAAQGTDAKSIADSAAHSIPTGRFSRPDEIAAAVLVLAGDGMTNMTGADIRIDGGLVPTW